MSVNNLPSPTGSASIQAQVQATSIAESLLATPRLEGSSIFTQIANPIPELYDLKIANAPASENGEATTSTSADNTSTNNNSSPTSTVSPSTAAKPTTTDNNPNTTNNDKSTEEKSTKSKSENDWDLFVGDLARNITEDDLREAFSSYGEVVNIDIKRDKYTSNVLGINPTIPQSLEITLINPLR